MIIEWRSDEEQIDIGDLIAAFPGLATEGLAGTATVRWDHKGEVRSIRHARVQNAVEFYMTQKVAHHGGCLIETQPVLLHWSEARPLLSSTYVDVESRPKPIPSCGDSGCESK